VIAAESPGAFPSYSPQYVAAIRAEKERLGVYPTRLDEVAQRIAADISYERLGVLHLVPLYFHRVAPEALLDALEAVTRRRSDDRALRDPAVRFGAAVMFEAVQTANQRRLLRSLVDALREEWQVFYQAYWERYRTTDAERIIATQRGWDALTLDLAGFLKANGLEQGTLILSPPLGSEARSLIDEPGGSIGALLSVPLPLVGEDVNTPLYAGVKALCFDAMDGTGAESRGDRATRPTELTRMTVRCGAMLLELHAPALLVGYRRFCLHSWDVDVSSGTTARAFEEAFPLEPEVVVRLREIVRRR
jgi:hypothetical protein